MCLLQLVIICQVNVLFHSSVQGIGQCMFNVVVQWLALLSYSKKVLGSNIVAILPHLHLVISCDLYQDTLSG